MDEKTNTSVLEVLQSKHPDARMPAVEDLEDHDKLPDFVELDITGDTISKVAWNLSGGGGPGRVDAAGLQQWLLRFGKHSKKLREELADFCQWMANKMPPWAAYRAFMANRLLALDKIPGVHPIGVGEIWR
jgi:hypothetical protein